MKFEFNLNEIDTVATQFLAQNPEKIILFNGEMGAGKTTFIKVLCKKLGITETTSSPTFSLVNEYQISENQKVYHFDLYRIKSQNEALDIGIEEYLYSGNWCFIEWSEKIPDLIPSKHTVVSISILKEGKRVLEINNY